jgi:ParB/RepB/Spo0J family partition protein
MTTTASLPDVALIRTEEIEDDGNVRRDLPNIEGLAASMAGRGMLTAVAVVRKPGGGFRLCAGSRRLAAARRLELESVPAVILPTDGTEADRILTRLAENLEREPLTDLEEADAVQQLLSLGADPEVMATTLHTTVENLEAWRAVAALPPEVRELIDAGTMTVHEAHQLAAVSDDPELLADCLRRIGDGWGVSSAVERASRERRLRVHEVASQARLAKEGCRVIAAPSYGTFAANSKTQRLGQGHGDVHITKRKHAKEPCHAAYIDRDGTAVFVCTDRSRHAGVEGSGVPDLRAERAAKRAEKKLLREAHIERFRAVGEALRNRAVPREEAVTFVLRLWVSDVKPKIAEVATELLGLAIPDQGGMLAAERALRAHAESGADELVDVALAIAAAAGEHGLTSDSYDYSPAAVAAHVRFLDGTGIHPLTEIERAVATARLPWDLRGAAVPDEDGQEPRDDPGENDTDGAAA